jgi:protein associated with RNAse G/E
VVENSNPVLIRVLNYDGTERRRWSGRLARLAGPLIIVDAVFEEEVHHDLLGTIASGTVSKEYYWLDRWYNVFRFDDRFYCNVGQPPRFEDGVLSYIDLDIDVLVEKDFSYKILDVEEFEASCYPAEIDQNVRQAVADLIKQINTRSFPFNE